MKLIGPLFFIAQLVFSWDNPADQPSCDSCAPDTVLKSEARFKPALFRV